MRDPFVKVQLPPQSNLEKFAGGFYKTSMGWENVNTLGDEKKSMFLNSVKVKRVNRGR